MQGNVIHAGAHVLIDAAGQHHTPVAADATVRIVSLVPSLTELLCALGLAPVLVGRTGFCIHPRALVQSIPKVGGTKDVDSARIRALAPTHLVVNVDENRKPDVEALAATVPHVIVTHPQGPVDNLALYRLFGALFGALPEVAARAQALCAAFEAAHAELIAACAQRLRRPPRPVLYCIWQDPWMTVARSTYIGQMLALIGWQQWEPPGTPAEPVSAGAARYPRFTWSSELAASIDCVLLSTEPYRFTQTHADQLEAQIGKPVFLVDGEMLSWYGSRAIAGLAYLKELLVTSGD